MPRLKFIVAGGFILVAISYLMFSGIDGSMVYFYTIPEMLTQPQGGPTRGIRVSGNVSPGTIQEYTAQSKVEFTMFDKETGQNMQVVYQGIIPDTFKDHSEVVVEGTYLSQDELFEANVLLAKCPSKYAAMGDEHPSDVPIEYEYSSDAPVE